MRKRFNNDEKMLIAWAANSVLVSWKDVSNWTKLAMITSPKILTDEGGAQYVEAENRTATATCSYGRKIRIYPTCLRRANGS